MKFVVDNQLPRALARLIQSELGAEAINVTDVGLRDAADAELWTYASINKSVLISKDEDFVNMVLHTPTARLVWVRVGNCRRAIILDLFRRMWPRIVDRLKIGHCFIEIR